MSPALPSPLHGTRVPVLLLLALLLLGCVDEIDLGQADALPEGIVVRGSLAVTSDGAVAEINLERLFQFSSNLPNQVVSARVLLENTEGQSLPIPYRNGAYRLDIGRNHPEMTIRPGVGYRLTIFTQDDEAYQSDYDVLQPALPLESAGRSFVSLQTTSPAGTPVTVPGINYTVTTPVRYPDGAPARLRYQLSVDYALTDEPAQFPYTNNDPKTCYVSQTLAGNRLFLLDGRQATAERVVDYPLATVRINHLYAEGNYVTIYQEALSPPAFNYFSQIASIADQDRSIFGSPPGPVAGNVTDLNGLTPNVFGFFYTANRTLARVSVSPEEAGNPNTYCPLPPPERPNAPPTSCDDCMRLDGASLTPPPFWSF
ncbi:hypothetical protein GGR26_002669 [Lewinella marina]|uniref:DUF4249 domain-containing protein n=1 Tax=Neolewinella marina TaxID=438751 RepID=A0A2G0CDA6_9BACT|nr:DUF4249 family protein [Neolewinella marina]NJB86892.1 hypothetical protein [Neolewinella marina]PHK97910.1 hypothetical protein CGL56_13940 [Neolewinella marina]